MQTDKFILTVTHTGKFDPVLLGDMVAARAWTMDGVEFAEGHCITADAFTRMARDLADVPFRSARLKFGNQPAYQFDAAAYTPERFKSGGLVATSPMEQRGRLAGAWARVMTYLGLSEVAQ